VSLAENAATAVLAPRSKPRRRTDLALFWEMSGDMFSAYDPEGRLVDVNPAWQRVLGWERHQLLGRPIMDFLHPDDLLTAASAADVVVANSGRVQGIESRLLCADGSYRWVAWSAYIDERGWYGVAQDISERKGAEAARQVAEKQVLQSRDFNQATLDSLHAHIAVLDESGTITFVNDAWARFASLNGAPGLGVGESYLRACDAAAATATAPEAGPVAHALRQMLEGSLQSYELEYPCHSPDEERWFSLRVALHHGGGPPRMVVQHYDITQRVLAEQGQRMRSRLLDEVDASVIATDPDGTVTLWSKGAERLYGWAANEACGKPVEDLTVPTDLRGSFPAFMRKLSGGEAFEGNLELCRKDGSGFTGFVKCSAVSGRAGPRAGFIGVSVDATERVKAAAEVREARDYLEAVLQSVGEGVITVDHSGALVFMNEIAEERLGWTCDALLGKNFHETAHYRRPDGSPYPMEECPLMAARFGTEATRVDDDVFYRRDGSPLPVSYTSAPYVLPDGETGAVVVFADITERKRAESALRSSEAQLKAIIDNTSALVYVKRRSDYRYVLGNPEFERLFHLEPGGADGLCDEDLLPPEVVEVVRANDRRVVEDGVEFSAEEEIVIDGGLRTFLTLKVPLRDDQGTPYAVCGISTDISEKKARDTEENQRAECEARIRTAIDDDRLLVYAQPIVDLRSGSVVQEELLVRMQGPRGPNDIAPPGEFLPAAERFGLVKEIDRFMVRRGIRLAAGGRPVEINLSGHSISDRELTNEIEREILTTGADPSSIVFEITETAAVEDLQAAREFSDRIARLGCRCALDDFGTGYGSLTYQRHLIVQFLKIDISFVRGMADSHADQLVVKSIVKLARDFGQQTIAEGVEDEQTLQLLREFGVDYAQGYHLGRPSPLRDS